jgi:hypothetical protein
MIILADFILFREILPLGPSSFEIKPITLPHSGLLIRIFSKLFHCCSSSSAKEKREKEIQALLRKMKKIDKVDPRSLQKLNKINALNRKILLQVIALLPHHPQISSFRRCLARTHYNLQEYAQALQQVTQISQKDKLCEDFFLQGCCVLLNTYINSERENPLELAYPILRQVHGHFSYARYAAKEPSMNYLERLCADYQRKITYFLERQGFLEAEESLLAQHSSLGNLL